MNTYDIIAVGDVVIDELLLISNENIHSRLHENGSEICFKYGQKIIVDSREIFIGGNAYNVAIGLARAGMRVGLCTQIGDDEFSQKIINSLRQEHVDTRFIQRTKGAQSSFTIAIQFGNDRTLFVDHVEREHNFSFENIQADWIYLTNLREQWKHAYKQVVEFTKKHSCKLVFNPGTSQLQEGYHSIKDVLDQSYIILVSKEEAQQLVVSYNPNTQLSSNSMRDLLITIQNLGPKIVIISDGEYGSYMINDQKTCFQLGTLTTKIIDKTGAGDAYAVGFLAAIIHGKTLQEAMVYGTINAGSVITKTGPQSGLLSWGFLKGQAKQHPYLIPQTF